MFSEHGQAISPNKICGYVYNCSVQGDASFIVTVVHCLTVISVRPSSYHEPVRGENFNSLWQPLNLAPQQNHGDGSTG